ncbi:expressed unknown protein [Seminavis robusta]|uniref:Uncharacterized protein n=1 Tax=Seminavis robusta TaxID=568900 RepID=A0A9N8DKU0_9STRA|nr:expressed unknown protein [Seminavis robusta]|eukprot:Sro210_g087590.1 n/a (298) ;mRNA; f:30879-31905
MIQQTTVYQTRQQSRRRTTKDKAAKQVTRARLGISNHVQANKLEKTTGMPAKGLRGNTGPAAAGAHHIKPCAAVSGAHARSNTLETTRMPAKGLRGNTGPELAGAHNIKPSAARGSAHARANTLEETTGMPVKGLQGNTGPAAAGAHNIKPSAAVSGAHARANTLEETTGMPVKGLQGNTGPTAAGAHQAKPSAAVGGALPLLRGLGKNRTTTVEATNATNYHGAYTCENLQRVQSLDFEPVHNNNHNENENEYVINENEIEYAINDPDIVLLPPTNDQGLVEARPIMEESEICALD